MRKQLSGQISMGLLEQMDERSRKGNRDAIHRHMIEDLPVTESEAAWLPEGVRLARHVHSDECHNCNFDTSDHTQAWKWGQPVCLKDVYALEKKLGKPLESSFKVGD